MAEPETSAAPARRTGLPTTIIVSSSIVPAIVYIADREYGACVLRGRADRSPAWRHRRGAGAPAGGSGRRRDTAKDRARALDREAQLQEVGEGSDTSTTACCTATGASCGCATTPTLLPTPDGELRWHGVMTVISDYKRLEAELECRAAQQAAVAKLGEHALEGASPGELLEEAVTVAATLLKVELAAMAELIPDEAVFHVRAYHSDDAAVSRERIPATAETQPGYTVLSRAPVVVEDWLTETRFAPPSPAFGLRSGASVLIEGSHGTFGVLSVQSRRPRGYRSEEVDFLQSLANVLADALERQAIEDGIRHRALHDRLTGLPNRVLFLDRLEQALARLRRAAPARRRPVPRPRPVQGDQRQPRPRRRRRAAASRSRPRLQRDVRARRHRRPDRRRRVRDPARGHRRRRASGRAIAERMQRRACASRSRIGGASVLVTASIGIAVGAAGDEPPEDAAPRRRRRDVPGQERAGRATSVFDAEHARAARRRGSSSRTTCAARSTRERVRVHYQPIVSLIDGAIVGFEALRALAAPERGLVSPAEFIRVAEETGLIVPIGRWVLEEACRQAPTWQRGVPDAGR